VFKVPVVGDGAVGKTSLILRYTRGVFREDYKITIGTSFAVHTVKLGNAIIKLQIWDLAGQPHFKGVRPLFYRGSTGVIYVFSVTDRTSFQNIPNWVEEVRRIVGPLPSILVGNKTDLADQRVVTPEEGQALGAQLGFPYIETSAKADLNVGNAFQMIAEAIIRAKWPQWTPDQAIPIVSPPAQPAPASPAPVGTSAVTHAPAQPPAAPASPPAGEAVQPAQQEAAVTPTEEATPPEPETTSLPPEPQLVGEHKPEEVGPLQGEPAFREEVEVPEELLPTIGEEEEAGPAGQAGPAETPENSVPSVSEEGSAGPTRPPDMQPKMEGAGLEEFAGVDVGQLSQEEFDERVRRALRRLGVDEGGVLGSYLRDLSSASQRDVVMRTLRNLQAEKEGK